MRLLVFGSVTALTRPRTHRLATVLVAAGAALTAVACGTGVDAQTQEWYDPADGVNNDVDMTLTGMAVRTVIVVSDGTDATVIGTFVNGSDDSDGVRSIDVAGSPATIDGDLDVEPGQSVRLGPPGEARAQADGVDLVPGSTTTVDITFEVAPAESLTAVVVPESGDYADSGPQ